MRVSNGHPDTVDVWCVRDGDPGSARRLGWVAGRATRTFLLANAAGPTRVVATSRDTHETLVSEIIAVDGETDIGLGLAPALVDSRLEVQRLQVVREVR